MRTTALWCLACVALCDPLQFKAAVHVAAIDVTVVDSQGNPVEGLTAADFDVTVAKRPGPVLAVDFIRLGSRASFAPPAPIAAAPAAPSDVRPARSRNVLFLLDDLSFKPLPAKELGLALEHLMLMVDADDVVGMATTSGMGPNVTPTVDRAPIRAALKELRGRREELSAPFVIGIDEALAAGTIRTSSSAMTERECAIVQLGQSCPSMVGAAARREAIAAVRRTADQVRAIRDTIGWMKSLPEPRVLIVVSDGIAPDPGHDLGDQLRQLSEAATAAGVLVYALTGVGDAVDVSDISYERRRARVSERRFLSGGVQTVASAAGGQSFVVVGQPNRFLQRIVRETSAIYQLAIEIPAPSGRDPRYLDVRVKVKRPGVTVRVKPLALRKDAI